MIRQSILFRLALVLSLWAVGVSAAAVAADDRPRPSIFVESGYDATRLWVDAVLPDGSAHHTLLRETQWPIYPEETGWDPTGKAGFATWDESGDRWFSHSRDGGRTWSEPRSVQVDLRLRDGAVSPRSAMPDAPGYLTLPTAGRLFLVQFKTISLPEWRDAVEDAGAELLAYLPHNAHVVRLRDPEGDPLSLLADLAMVERVEPYHPWYRLSSDLRDWLENQTSDSPERMPVRIVVFEWGPNAKTRLIRAAVDLGAEVPALRPNGHLVELVVDREQLLQISAHDDVQWIDAWSPSIETMDLVRGDTGFDGIEPDLGYCGEGVRGEVMDAGIQLDHPDFGGEVLIHGVQPGGSDHGTSTFGIVFGRGDGDARATGRLPCGEGIFADGHFVADRFAHTEELKYAPFFASFQSNSWSTKLSTGYDGCSHEMDDIVWRLDIAILQAQGNAGSRLGSCQAWAKNVISVGGIWSLGTPDGADDAWRPNPETNAASIGPAEDGRIKPDLVSRFDSGYTSSFAGTSAATAETAGMLGLMVEMWSENVWETDPVGSTVFERQPHFSTTKALMINSAEQYPFLGDQHDLSRFKQGWGRPSVRSASERAPTSFIVDQEVMLRLGERARYEIDVAEGEAELRLTMTYPDPPGNPASLVHRVNDLDLRVTSPAGVVYHGNVGLTDGNHSLPGGGPDGIDTVENVFVIAPEPGIWEVEIRASEVNQDAVLSTIHTADATFSLVVTGAAGV